MSTRQFLAGQSRRRFLLESGAFCAVSLLSRAVPSADAAQDVPGPDLGFPLIDYHVHLDNSTIDKVVELSRQRGVKFGIVEHAGTKENKYPIVLSNDAELKNYVAMLEGKPVSKGVQAEWTDWMGCFSPETLGLLDFVLTDAMTFPGEGGARQKLWEPGYTIKDKQEFMDRFVEWHVGIITKQPIDILANVSWLPAPLAPEYDAFWTTKRMERVIDAALKCGVAIEISSSFKLPKLPFLQLAKAAGIKFCLGSNGRYPNMGKLEHSIEMARQLGLKKEDMFVLAPPGQKPFQRRKLAS